jgi:flagellar biosynthesis protein FlhF
MAIKRYKAISIQEAISRIKEDIGPDAMILSTRRLPRGTYGHEMFEVTATQHNTSSNKERGAAEQMVSNFDGRNSDVKRPKHRAAPTSSIGEKWKDLNAELFSIKDMLFLIEQAGGLPDFLHWYPESLNLYVRLVKTGISERRARKFMKSSLEKDDWKRLGTDGITKRVINEILSTITVFDPFSPENGNRHLAAFIGPTGVGKTTTIAKLAAVLGLQQKKRLGIISVDSYRIGAVDQLRTYAAIMGFPCLSAFSPQELQMAVGKMRDKDIVLIDTAGQSHLDRDRMNELGRLMKGEHQISSHLVLNATIERHDMKEVAESFSKLKPKTYIFTKLDETRRRGAIIDQIDDLKMPISYITNGQRVPEDILPARKKSILQMILKRE